MRCMVHRQIASGCRALLLPGVYFMYKTTFAASPWVTWELCQLVAKQPLTNPLRTSGRFLTTDVPQGLSSYSFSSVRWCQSWRPAGVQGSCGAWAALQGPEDARRGSLLADPLGILQPPGCPWDLSKLNSPRHCRKSSELLRCPWLKTSLP